MDDLVFRFILRRKNRDQKKKEPQMAPNTCVAPHALNIRISMSIVAQSVSSMLAMGGFVEVVVGVSVLSSVMVSSSLMV